MSVLAGELRHRITIQNQVQAQDPNTGEITKTWVDLLPNIAASVNPVSARELTQSQQTLSQLSTRFVIRYQDGINASMRVVYKSVYYNIDGVIADNESGLQWITLACSSGVTDG